MPKRVLDAPVKEIASSTLTLQLNPGTAANRRAINFRAGFDEILVEAEDQDSRFGFAPKLMAAYHYDDSAAQADRFIDLLALENGAIANSGVTGTVQLAALAAVDYLYLGFSGRVGGFRADLTTPFNTAANSNWASDQAQYSTGNGWVGTAITDGTEASANVAFGQDGNIQINTVPADGVWQPNMLNKIISTQPVSTIPTHGHVKLYWLRLQPTNAFNAATTINQIIPLLVAVANGYGDGDAGFFKGTTEYTMDISSGRYGAIEGWASETGASDLRITWIKR